MAPGRLPLALALLVTTSMISALAAATPPRPGTENNSLSENESATLWSRDDDQYITADAYRDAYGEERTAMQELANGTDITFKRPPETASIWTRNDHRDYTPGNESTSVYPEHASLTNSTFIEDAHATFFSVTPSTKTHTAPTETRWYVAPAGQVRGTVDYRVRVPATVQVGNRTISWTVQRHEISEVRLLHDGEVIAPSRRHTGKFGLWWIRSSSASVSQPHRSALFGAERWTVARGGTAVRGVKVQSPNTNYRR